MQRNVAVAWTFGGVCLALLALSLAGSGTGPLGGGFFTRMLWSYLLLIGGAALGLWIAVRGRPETMAEATR